MRKGRVLEDRIKIVERLYDKEFDSVKTEAAEREVPFDSFGFIKAALVRNLQRSKYIHPRPATARRAERHVI